MVNPIARKSPMKTVLALVLAFASGSAAALGLGQIELKSRLGEPLLAEIAIVSSDPEELRQLSAGLASPETFARVGLEPPTGTVAALRFEPALNDAGDAVIRVTSSQPIDQSVLTFLIEVDWGQGRLVREYSTLLDAPRTVSAPLQPPVDAPVVAPSNAIVRAPEVAPAPQPGSSEPEPLPTARADAEAVAQTDPDPEPAPPTQPVARAVAPIPPTPPASQYGAVESGETLSQIADGLGLGVSLDQAMIALLRANPNAFINGNVNLLKQGAVLRVPLPDELNSIGRAEASALVQTQVRQWRQARAAVALQIADAAGEADPSMSAAAAARQTSGARLEIVPPGASRATRAGTQSGISAGGEGEMLRQELIQTRETLAARDAELAEMQARVAELEKLQSDQQQLISMKDSQLAAAQQRLGTTDTPPPETASGNSFPWIFGGVVLLLALIAGWAISRRNAATPAFRAPPDKPRSSLADAFAPSAPAVPAATTTDAPADEFANAERFANSDDLEAPDPGGTLPLWEQGDRSPRAPARGSAAAAGAATPAWHDPGAASVGQPDAITGAASVQPGAEELQRARAYLDLGDHASARLLLAEIVASGDADHSRQAARMLHELD